ncbi:MAG: adenylate kinase [bacterium]|nr:adenylate kinase [bacterium]
MAAVRLVMLGPPGAGKGTQARRLADDLGLLHIATGDILRQAAAADTDLGRQAAAIMSQGGLVPDAVMIGLIAERLGDPAATGGFVLDGFPRTVEQAQALDELMREQTGREIDAAVYLDAPEEELVRRSASRRVCRGCGANYNLISSPPRRESICDACGGGLYLRDDDREGTVRRRLAVYRDLTHPVTAYYDARGCLRRVDGLAPPDQVYQDLRRQLAGLERA